MKANLKPKHARIRNLNPGPPKLVAGNGEAIHRVTPDDGETVTVACKFPMGLRLRVFEMTEVAEPSPSGTHMVKMARQIGGPNNYVTIYGYNTDGVHLENSLVNPGFALTHNVPKLFWELWLEQNRDSALVKNGLIFAHAQPASVADQVKDHEDLVCGLEPIIPTPPAAGPWEPPPQALDPRVRSLARGLRVTTMSKD